MKIAYVSDNKIYCSDGNKTTEIPCGRIIKYREALDSIRRRKEWKSTGTGAQFTGAAADMRDSSEIPARVSGIADNDGTLVYSVMLDESGSLYSRSYDRTDDNEGLILSGNDTFFGSFDCFKGRLAVSMGATPQSLHIASLTPPSSVYEEYTDGDTIEENPYWSRTKNGIFFSTAGYARNEMGIIGSVSPREGVFLNLDTNELEQLLSDPKYDYLRLKESTDGSLYYIRQSYSGSVSKGGAVKDFLLVPYRIIQGFFGWISFMCLMWGGESLKSGDTLDNMLKSRNRSKKDLVIEGNIIKAERLAKEGKLKDGTSSIMPLDRVLIKRSPDGSEEVISRGVLDYSLCSDGSIMISDGRRIAVTKNGTETLSIKARLAMNLTEVT